MKYRLPCFILIAVMIMSLLTSCSPSAALMKLEEGERADLLFDITNSVYTDSYLVRLESKISGILERMKMELRITGDSYFIGMNSEDPIIHFETNAETEVFLSASSSTSRMRMRSGYRDGKMYIQNATSSSLYSRITAEEYLAHLSEDTSADNEALALAHKSAATKSCIRKEDGNWLATFSGFPEESLSLLISNYFNSSVLMLDKASIIGMTVEVEATKRLELIEIRYTLHFDGNASAETTLKILEADEKSLPKIDLYKFREVSDLRVIDIIRNKFSDKLNSASGQIGMIDIVIINQYGDSDHTRVESDISYSSGEEGFTFNYSYGNPAVPDTIAELNYKDGKLISGSGTVMDSSMNELEARSYILSLVDSGDLINALISDFEIDEKDPNKYIFHIDSPSITRYYTKLGNFPFESIKSSAILSVTLKDDAVAEYTYYLKITAEYSNRRISITQSNTRTFE